MRTKRIEGRRLAYYDVAADPAFWDSHWRPLITGRHYEAYLHGNLDEYGPLFLKYLRGDGPILEAGCGTGKYVLALKHRGFAVEGIEWGTETVDSVMELFPGLPIQQGDATGLRAPNNHYGGYISLGVMEHRRDGPEPFIKEAYRILRPGGVAWISVPYFNALRRLKANLGLYRVNEPSGMAFYQYAFSKEEFVSMLEAVGFRVLETSGLGAYYGLKEEVALFFDYLNRLRGGWRIRRFIKSLRLPEAVSHTMLFVAEKPELGSSGL